MYKYSLYFFTFTTNLTLSILLTSFVTEGAGLSDAQKAAIAQRKQQVVQSVKSTDDQNKTPSTGGQNKTPKHRWSE